MTEAVVIDCGTGLSKAGLSAQDAPRCQFPTIVGKPKLPSIMVGMEHKQSHVGQQAHQKSNVLHLQNPIKAGVIQNWQDMSQVIHHIYYSELRVTPEQHPCLLTEIPKNPIKNRHKTTEIMFESINVPQFYLSNQAVLALFATGRTTGLVLDSGAGVTSSVPIFEGYAIPHAMKKNDFAGLNIDEFIISKLKQQNVKLNLYQDQSRLKQIKSRSVCCNSAKQYENLKNSANVQQNKYLLPDGQQINISNIARDASEILFTPELFNYNDIVSLPNLIKSTIDQCDKDIRRDLYNNMITSGGTSNLQNFGRRLGNQLSELYPSQQINIDEKDHREFLTWLGGSILSALPTFQNMWISRSQYMQHGASIIDKKCF